MEDMGHKQGCNGVDNGKLWFNRELFMLQTALSASREEPAAAEQLPGCSCAKQLGHLQLLEVRPGVLVHVFPSAACLLQALH